MPLSPQIYRAILDGLNEAVLVIDAEGYVCFSNARANVFFGDPLGENWRSSGCAQRQWLDHHLRPLNASGTPLERLQAGQVLQAEELILVDGDQQSPRWVAVSGGPAPGQPAGWIVLTIQDISPYKHREAALLKQAVHDELTGLPNRSLFLDRVSHALARAQEHPGLLMALLFIDLDRFKVVNDNLGHGVGNQLLVELGSRLRAALRPEDTLARLGGDEFAVLIEDISTGSSAIALAEQLRSVVTQPFQLQAQDVYIDASIGIALGPGSYDSPELWLRDADTAMYQIKDMPTQGWHIFDSSLQIQQDQRLQLEIGLRQALTKGELRLHYQPIVTISNQTITGFEALVRLQHPTRGLLPPVDFITIAEETGLIIPLGWWVLEEACRQMQTWTSKYPAMADFTVSVNMSSKQFTQPNLVQKVEEVLTGTGFDPKRLKIEITEGVLIDNSDTIITILHQLKAMGIQLLVDDFGTGYSSLSYLHRFPFDCLKIDRSFIENADQDFEKLEILQSVVRLAWNLGLDVVAEGIETSKHYAQLKALRCELGQGYLFSRPLAPDAIEAMLVERLGGKPSVQPSLGDRPTHNPAMTHADSSTAQLP